MIELAQHYLHLGIAAILASFALGFMWMFFVPALRIGGQLKRANAALGKIKSEGPGAIIDLERIARESMTNERLAHCWAEFAETLHPQKEMDEYGQEKVLRWRSTALADGACRK